jgi:bifunctional ADP-heptose synthase (sugar kinase/adenylyltransferase)
VAGHAGIDVRGTLGAGDVFHGALVAALVREMPLPEALAYANAAAALSCRGLDGRSGIPDDAETRALAAHLPATPLSTEEIHATQGAFRGAATRRALGHRRTPTSNHPQGEP